MSSVDGSWIKAQQSTFTNWCNDRLKDTETKIDNLVTELDDGVKLVILLEQLAKRKVAGRIYSKPRFPLQRSENLQKAFAFMKNKEGIHLINICPNDIQEQNQKLILGVIWALILKYQILVGGEETHEAAKDSKKPKKPPSAKKLLLNWLQVAMPEDQPVINLTSNWNNAQRLSALVNVMKPGTIDLDLLCTGDALANTKLAMDKAESEFGIPKILEPELMCLEKVDEPSVMTYLSYFCCGEDSPGYESLLAWVRSKIPEYNIHNLTKDWRDGRALSALVNALVEGSLPNHASLDPSNGVENLRTAMTIASRNLQGIRDNITPEEFADEHTCTLAMMCYFESLRKAKPLSSDGPVTDDPLLAKLLQADLITRKESESLASLSDVVTVQSGKYHEVAIKSADILRSLGFVNESRLLAVLAQLGQADLITTEERRRICCLSDVVAVQSHKSPGVLAKTAEVLKRNGLEKESIDLSVKALHAELQHKTGLVTSEESTKMTDLCAAVQAQSSKSVEMMHQSVKLMKRHGFKEEAKLLSVIDELLQAGLLASEECRALSDLKDVVRVQQSKSLEVIAGTTEILTRNGFAKESQLLSVVSELQQADLITSEQCTAVNEPIDVVSAQRSDSPEVVSKTAEVLSRHGLEKESKFLTVLFELQQASLITTEERAMLTDLSSVIAAQKHKSHQVMADSAGVLKRNGFKQESRFLLVQAVVAELRLSPFGLVTSKDRLSHLSDVIRVQTAAGKSTTKMIETAKILRRHGLEREAKYLEVRALIVDLQQALLITSEESKWWTSPSEVVRAQRSKSLEKVEKTAETFKKNGYEKEHKFLSVLVCLQRENLITREECEQVNDVTDIVRVQHGKSLLVLRTTATRLGIKGFIAASEFLLVLVELQEAGLITSEERLRMTFPTDVARVQSVKSREVVVKTAVILKKHEFRKESIFLAILADLHQAGLITGEECGRLCDPSDVVRLQISKSPEVMAKTAVVLKKHEFEKEFELLADAAFLPSLPTMELLSNLVVPTVSSQWREVGLQLEICPNRLQTIGNRYFMSKKDCCTAMFEKWLYSATGTGSKQRSWESVLHAVKTAHSPTAEECIRKDLREHSTQLVYQKADHTSKLSVEEPPQKSQAHEVLVDFEENYSEVVSTSASVLLKITKCTTIGPPGNGKTCLKHLLAEQSWDVGAGTGGTDVMKAPGWVECYSVEEGGELWKQVSKEQQLGELLRAINTSATSCDQLRSTPSVVPPTTMPSVAPPTTTPSVVPPKTIPSIAPPTTTPSVVPPTTPPSTFQTLEQGVKALDCVCSGEQVQRFLKDRDGKVLGETRLVHFIDPAGHAVYNDVHPALITSPSVYFVVFSLEDFYWKNEEQRLAYFRSDLIQCPLKSIYTFGTKPLQEKDSVEFHPEAPRIFIVGTHLDQIAHVEGFDSSVEQFLVAMNDMIESEIATKPYCQFVEYDPNGLSFWAVDNTQAAREQGKGAKEYVSDLRKMVLDQSMEMSVRIPLPWLLLKFVMEGKGVQYCKYSELLQEARIRGYVREHSPDADLDTMLRLFHNLGLIYHKAQGGRKEDSLVFIAPDCLYSATFDFLTAAKEEMEDSDVVQLQTEASIDNDIDSRASSEEEEDFAQTPTDEERRDCELAKVREKLLALEVRGTVGKQAVIERIKTNAEALEQEMEAVVLSAKGIIARIGQEPTEVVLKSLHAQLKEMGEDYKLPPGEGQDASTLKDERKLFLGRLVHSLASSVETMLGDLGKEREAHLVEKEVATVLERAREYCLRRSIDCQYMDQFFAVLSDLRIIAHVNNSDRYVVPAALPKTTPPILDSATSVLLTVVSQSIAEECYLPSGLFCHLISELVTGQSWTVKSLERYHAAFAHDSVTGMVHLKECESYIEINVESEASPQELSTTCQTVREKINTSVNRVCTNLYSGPSDSTKFEDMVVWGFHCETHGLSDESHIAALQEEDDECYAECLLQGYGAVQDVTQEQIEWLWDSDGDSL